MVEQRFKLVAGKAPKPVEEELNEWAAENKPKIKRTQLAASNTHGIVVLVTYEIPALNKGE